MGAAAVAAGCRQGPRKGPDPAARARVALHPRLRGVVDRPELAVLRRASDGRRIPGHLRRRLAADEGNRRPLDAARADVGRRARVQDAWVLPVAEHGQVVWLDLAAARGLRPEPKRAADDWRAYGPADSTDRPGRGARLREPLPVQRAPAGARP